MVYMLDIIRSGWTRRISDNQFTSGCTISLLRGPKTILIDPGSPWDSEYIQSELFRRNVDLNTIDFVICTHEHVDHLGNLHLFPNATILIGCTLIDKAKIDNYVELTDPFELDHGIQVIHTPGHTSMDISVIVDIESFGRTAIVGDLFECEEDLFDSLLWKSSSYNIQAQKHFRKRIFNLAEYIVPGHGPPFKKPNIILD